MDLRRHHGRSRQPGRYAQAFSPHVKPSMHRMRRAFALPLTFCIVLLAACAPPEGLPGSMEGISGTSPVKANDGTQAGKSTLQREPDRVILKLEACCLIPGNAYTAWWLIGEVTRPMSSAKSVLATGFVAEAEQVELELELGTSSKDLDDSMEGVRLAVLDHGPATGDPMQLTTPEGGCEPVMCPVLFTTAHAAR